MRFVLLVLLVAGCQDNIHTEFPDGLMPFEDNPIAAQPDGPFDETLRTASTNNDYIHVYARGFVQVPPEMMWTVAKDPAPNASVCKTDEQQITPGNEPQYEFSFLIHYIVNNVVTVEWDDQWRFGWIDDGSEQLGMIRHQKVQGSDFITLSEGTIQVWPTSDPGVAELQFVEHFDAVQASTTDVLQGVQHNYDALVAVAHGNPLPPCP